MIEQMTKSLLNKGFNPQKKVERELQEVKLSTVAEVRKLQTMLSTVKQQINNFDILSSGTASNGTNYETVSQKAPTATTLHKVKEDNEDKSDIMRYNQREEPLTLRRLLMPPEEEEEFKIEPSFLIDNLSFSQINAAQRKHTDPEVRPFET